LPVASREVAHSPCVDHLAHDQQANHAALKVIGQKPPLAEVDLAGVPLVAQEEVLREEKGEATHHEEEVDQTDADDC
jgi:hypothetical protein